MSETKQVKTGTYCLIGTCLWSLAVIVLMLAGAAGYLGQVPIELPVLLSLITMSGIVYLIILCGMGKADAVITEISIAVLSGLLMFLLWCFNSLMSAI